MRELLNASLADMTTLGLGGPADRVIDAETEAELRDVVHDALSSDTPLQILGGGSNVVVHDRGWPGIVLRPALQGIDVTPNGDTVTLTVGAGEVWDDVVARCVDEGWSGLACLSGIPGWIGAAPLQNIGAYGHEVAECITSVRAFDREGDFTTFSRDDCGFGYRTSNFRQQPRFIVTSITLRLERTRQESIRYAELASTLGVELGASAELHAVRSAVLSLRRSKGMVVDPEDPESRSAGSFFVNPVVDEAQLRDVERRAMKLGVIREPGEMPRFEASAGRIKLAAGWLIERAGFRKGTTLSGVGISQKHALALVNRGGTTAALLDLERRVREGVMERFGVELFREPILIEPVE